MKKKVVKRAHKKAPKSNRFLIGLFFVVGFLILAASTRAYWATLLTSRPVSSIYGRAVSINDQGQVLIFGSVSYAEPLHPVIWKDSILYEVRDITDMSINPNSPNIFNNKTEFVGSDQVDGVQQGYIWTINGGVQHIGVNMGSVQATMTQAVAINNYSHILGIYTANGDSCTHMFIWDNNKWTLVSNNHLFCTVVPTDINDNDVISGYTMDGNTWNAFILDTKTNTYTEINSPGYKNVFPITVNNNNQVVGYANDVTDPSNQPKAFLWSNGSYTYLGTLGGNASIAYSINTNGYIAGVSDVNTPTDVPPEYHAFVIQKNNMVDLGTLDAGTGVTTLGTDALSINTTGIIVGTNYTFTPSITPDPTLGVTNYYQTPVTWDYILTKIKKPKNINNPHNTPTPTPIGG